MSKYNGWSNYKTWAVNHWIANENGQRCYRYWRERAAWRLEEVWRCRQVKDGVWMKEKAALFNLADEMQSEISGGGPELGPTLYSDLLNRAFSQVNWEQIAENWLEK